MEASSDLLGAIRSVRRYTHEKLALVVSVFERRAIGGFGRYIVSNRSAAYLRNSWLLCGDSENKRRKSASTFELAKESFSCCSVLSFDRTDVAVEVGLDGVLLTKMRSRL